MRQLRYKIPTIFRTTTYKQQVVAKFATTISYFILLAVAVITFLFYNQSLKQIDINEDARLDKYKKDFETKVDLSLNRIESYKSLSFLNDYVANDYDYRAMLQTMNALAKPLAYFLDTGVSLSVTKLSEDSLIYSTSTSTKQEFIEKYALPGDVCDTFDENQKYTFYRSENIYNNAYIIVKCCEILPQSNGKAIFFIIIDESKVIPKDNKEDVFLLADQNNLLSFGNDGDFTAIRNEIAEKMFKNVDYSRKIVDIKLNKYYAKAALSDIVVFKDLKFILLEERNIYDKTGELFHKFFYLIILVLFILGVFYTLKTATYLYEPVANLKKLFGSLLSEQNGFDDEENDLLYIENKAKEISSYYLSGISQGEHIRTTAISKFYADCILGMLNKEEITERMKELKIEIPDTPYLVALIDLPNDEQIFSYDLELLKEIEEKFSVDMALYIKSDIVMLDKTRFAQVIYSGDIKKIKDIYLGIIPETAKQLGVNVIVYLGSVVNKFSDVYVSFLEAKKLTNMAFLQEQKSIFVRNEMTEQEEIEYIYYPLEEEKKLIGYIINNNEDEAIHLLNEILSGNLDGRQLNSATNWKLIFAIMNTVNRILQAVKISSEDVFGEEMLVHVELKMAKTSMEFREKVMELFSIIMAQVKAQNSREISILAEDMLDYVNRNYNKDISLVDIATHFNMSIGYISFLFKKVTGSNFKEYLDLKRIEVAKQLMQTKNGIKIRVLSEKVGCNSVNTFIRLFKRHEGVSPGEYLETVNKNRRNDE